VLSKIAATLERLPSEVTLFLLVGMLGAFTTFSTLSKDTVDLFQSDHVPAALIHMGMHVILGLAAVGSGYELGRFVHQWRA
jgi:CrcB protein